MTEHEYFVTWCNIQCLVDDALGLALLGSIDCASDISNDKDRETARASTTGAAVVVLKQAQAMLNSIDPHGFTFKAEQPSMNLSNAIKSDTPVTDIRTACAVMLKENSRMPNKLTLSAETFALLADNPEVRSYLPDWQQDAATLEQLKIILGVTEIEISATDPIP